MDLNLNGSKRLGLLFCSWSKSLCRHTPWVCEVDVNFRRGPKKSEAQRDDRDDMFEATRGQRWQHPTTINCINCINFWAQETAMSTVVQWCQSWNLIFSEVIKLNRKHNKIKDFTCFLSASFAWGACHGKPKGSRGFGEGLLIGSFLNSSTWNALREISFAQASSFISTGPQPKKDLHMCGFGTKRPLFVDPNKHMIMDFSFSFFQDAPLKDP